jgi:hypothetical protein
MEQHPSKARTVGRFVADMYEVCGKDGSANGESGLLHRGCRPALFIAMIALITVMCS